MAIYTPPNSNAIRSDFLTDVELECRALGIDDPPVQPGTDWWLLGTAISKIALVCYANIEARDSASSELTATGDALDAKREALGLPVVDASPATGRVVLTVPGFVTRTLVEGTQLLYNGIRYEVSQTYVGVVDNDEVLVACLDRGVSGNQVSGTELKFVSPPLGIAETAIVSSQVPLTGGVDAEDDERKRARILNARRYKPEGGAGKIGHLREIAFNALASVQNVFVYPCLGGPSSVLTAITRKYDAANRNYTRAFDAAAVEIVRSAIHAEVLAPDEYVVGTVANEATNIALQLTIPDSVLIGGAGNGWSDAVPWPPLVVADSGRITVLAMAGNVVSISANTLVVPLDGITRIAWWSSVDQMFRTFTVVAHTGASGAWICTVDRNMVDSNGSGAAIGDYISPAMDNASGFAATWLASMEALGPSEMTTDAARLPRSYREPHPDVESPKSVSMLMLKRMIDKHPEITDSNFAYRSKTNPTVPGSVDSPPNILVTNHFGIYPL
jgi:hypothetical protein